MSEFIKMLGEPEKWGWGVGGGEVQNGSLEMEMSLLLLAAVCDLVTLLRDELGVSIIFRPQSVLQIRSLVLR